MCFELHADRSQARPTRARHHDLSVADTGLVAALPLSLSAGPKSRSPDRPCHEARRARLFVYGTQYARYTSQSATQTTTLGSKANSPVSMTLTGLLSSTMYHYRVVMIASEFNIGTFTNYSGADQTFTAGPAGSLSVPRTKRHPTKPSQVDRKYLKNAIQTDRAQISVGKLALATSRDRAVRRLARRSTTDHRLLLQDTVRLARSLRVRVPKSQAPTQIRAARLLSALSGSLFDRRYASLEVRAAQKWIRRAAGELRGGRNAAVLHAAKVALLILRLDLRLARVALPPNL